MANDNNPETSDAANYVNLGMTDKMIAGGITIGAFICYCIWNYNFIHPTVWKDAAIATGLEPAASVMPGLWTLIVRTVTKFWGNEFAYVFLKYFGRFVCAVSCGFTYYLFRSILVFITMNRPQRALRWRRVLVMRAAACLSVFVLMLSEPVWICSQTFSSTTLMFFMIVLATNMLFSFLRRGSLKNIYIASLLCGALAAESPLGLFIIIIFVTIYFQAQRRIFHFKTQLSDPSVRQVSKWHMTFLALFAFVVVLALNCLTYIWNGGLSASEDAGLGNLPLKFAMDYISLVSGAATPFGWILIFAVIILPFSLCVGMLPRATDDDRFLHYGVGIGFFVSALIALSQLSQFHPLWIWNIQLKQVVGGQFLTTSFLQVHSQLLVLVCVFLASIVLFASFSVLLVETFCRDHDLLVVQLYGEHDEDAEDGDNELRDDDFGVVLPAPQTKKLNLRIFKVLVSWTFVIGLAAGVYFISVQNRAQKRLRAMIDVIDEYANKTLDEAEGAPHFFSMGRFDSFLELKAAARRQKFYPKSLMAGNSPREIKIRSQGLSYDADILSSQLGTLSLLRSWIQNIATKGPQVNPGISAEAGLEVWRSLGQDYPPVLSTLARLDAGDRAKQTKALADLRMLSKKVLDFYAKYGGSITTCDRAVGSLFEQVQFRLARNAFYHSMMADKESNTSLANEMETLAKSLNQKNESYIKLLKDMENARRYTSQQYTPREGLQIALQNRDMRQASLFAKPLLQLDPSDALANFAMGMMYYEAGQFARAETYLVNCLALAPQQPAVYNSLAMTQLQLGKLRQAEANTRKALDFLPKSVEVLDTLEKVQHAKAERKAKGLDVEDAAEDEKGVDLNIDELAAKEDELDKAGNKEISSPKDAAESGGETQGAATSNVVADVKLEATAPAKQSANPQEKKEKDTVNEKRD